MGSRFPNRNRAARNPIPSLASPRLIDCQALSHLPDWEEGQELVQGQDGFRPIREVDQDEISIEMFRRYNSRLFHAETVS